MPIYPAADRICRSGYKRGDEAPVYERNGISSGHFTVGIEEDGAIPSQLREKRLREESALQDTANRQRSSDTEARFAEGRIYSYENYENSRSGTDDR